MYTPSEYDAKYQAIELLDEKIFYLTKKAKSGDPIAKQDAELAKRIRLQLINTDNEDTINDIIERYNLY